MFLSLFSPPASLSPSDKLLVVPHGWVGLAGNPASRLPGQTVHGSVFVEGGL